MAHKKIPSYKINICANRHTHTRRHTRGHRIHICIHYLHCKCCVVWCTVCLCLHVVLCGGSALSFNESKSTWLVYVNLISKFEFLCSPNDAYCTHSSRVSAAFNRDSNDMCVCVCLLCGVCGERTAVYGKRGHSI